MSIPNNLQDVVVDVETATWQGRAGWKPGPTSEMVFLNLDDFSVQLFKQPRPPGIIAVNDRWPISFTILDSSGARVERFTLDSGDGDWERLSRLFEKARQIAIT